jgi:hypothetical protein
MERDIALVPTQKTVLRRCPAISAKRAKPFGTGEVSMSDAELLSVDQALAMLPDGEYVHTFRNPGGMLLGAEWGRAEIEEAIRASDRRELAGELATRMKHGLVIRIPGESSLLFVATHDRTGEPT